MRGITVGIRSLATVVVSLAFASCSDSSSGPNGGAPALTNSIAFISDRTHTDQLFVMNADGSNLRQLTDIPGQKADDTVSADGRSIAFTVYPNDFELITHLYIVGSDGTKLTKLTDTRNFDSHPSFSADGQNIIFSRSAGDTTSIYEIRTDGSHLANFIHHHGQDYNATVRPGSSSLLFVSDRDHLGGINSEIYSSDGLGLAVHPLVEGFDPAWPPDGQKFLFKRDGQIWISDTPVDLRCTY